MTSLIIVGAVCLIPLIYLANKEMNRQFAPMEEKLKELEEVA